MATPLATLVCTGLTLPDHAYTDCVYCHPEDMVLIAQQLGADPAQLVKRGILVTVNGGAGELVAFLKCVRCLRAEAAGAGVCRLAACMLHTLILLSPRSPHHPPCTQDL